MIKTINDLTLTTQVIGDMQLEIDLGGTVSEKVKVDQLKDYIYTGEDLANLRDVSLGTLQNNDILRYDFDNELWRNVQLPEVTLELAALNDVQITAPSNNEFLKYDALLSKWINATLPDPVTALSELNDVSLSGVQDNDYLKYDSNAQAWVNSALPDPVDALSELNDVSLNNVQNNQYLRYNTSAQAWVNGTLPSIPNTLQDLNNVDILNPANNQYLGYDSTSQEWENKSLPFIPSQLQDLNNVTVNNLQNNDILRYNTSESRWENKVLLQPLLNDLQDVHLSSLQNSQALVYNAAALEWQNQTLSDVSLQNAIHVAKNGNDTTGNGTLSKPYLTITKALEGISGSVRVIVVAPGEYTENLNISTALNLTIQGMTGAIDSSGVVIHGHITISGTSTRVRLVNLNVQGFTAGTPTVFDNGSQGRHYITNCAISHSNAATAGLQVSGGFNWVNCDLTSVDKVNLTGTLTAARTISFANSNVGPVTISSPFYTCQAARSNAFGPVTHQAGVLAMSEVSLIPNLSVPAITSTVNLGLGAVYLIGVNFQQADGSYLAINKTGTCPYLVAYCNRNPAIDTLNGTRISFGMPSQDIGANYTPVNYTPADGSLRAHLAAIDVRLGQLSTQVGTTLALA